MLLNKVAFLANSVKKRVLMTMLNLVERAIIKPYRVSLKNQSMAGIGGHHTRVIAFMRPWCVYRCVWVHVATYCCYDR